MTLESFVTLLIVAWLGLAGVTVIFRRRLHQLIGRNGCCAASS